MRCIVRTRLASVVRGAASEVAYDQVIDALRSTLGRFAPRSAPQGPSRSARHGREHVLVTGARGAIGRIVSRALSEDYDVHGLDVKPGPEVEWVRNMAKAGRLAPAFEGVSTVIDLAANANASASWDSVRRNNIPATMNAFEAARRAGVARVIFASSNHVVGMYEHDEPYASVVAGAYDGLEPAELPRLAADAPIRPDGPYGIGKAFGEAAGRYYADAYGLSIICLRIGTVNAANRPMNPRHFATLLTHRDLVHLVRCCLSAPESVRFAVYYGVSDNTWRLWEIEDARAEIGYEPQDDAEAFRSHREPPKR